MTESVNLKQITPTNGASITDSSGEVWTLHNGHCRVNGVIDATTSNVVLIVYSNHLVYQEDSSGSWWYKSVSANPWIATVSPLVTSIQTAIAGNFSCQNGLFFDPSGSSFIGRGVNVYYWALPGAVTNAACQPLTTLFPNIGIVRLNAGSEVYPSVASLQPYIDLLVAQNIVVAIEDHLYPQASPPTGAAQENWYASFASYYKNQPFVWFMSTNEANQPGVEAGHAAIYNAVRGAGNNNIILFDPVVGGGPGLQGPTALNASTYANMTNVGWDQHFYAWMVSRTTDQPTVNAGLASFIAQDQQISSLDGVMPVLIGEWGDSTDGASVDADWQNIVSAVTTSGHGSAAWNFSVLATADILVDTNGNLTQYGQLVSNYTAAGTRANQSTGTSPPPSPTPPAPPPAPVGTSPDGTLISAGSSATITDGNGNKWTLPSNGSATENGTPVAGGGGTSAITIYGGVIFAQDKNTLLWYQWNGSNFIQEPLPNPPPAPPPGPSPPTPTPPSPTPSVGLRNWYDNPGGDGTFWVTPFQTTAQWITGGAQITSLRNGDHGSPTGLMNVAGNYGKPWYVGHASDPLVTVTDGNVSIQVHIPLGAITEGPASQFDQNIGGVDATHPYLVWSISGASINTGSVQASGSVITGTYGFSIDDGAGPVMTDALTGQPGTGNAFGGIQDYDMSLANSDPNYVIQHMLQFLLDPNQVAPNAPLAWPLLVRDTSFTGGGTLAQGYTIGIPASTPRPTGQTRGFYLLFDTLQQFGAFNYNFGAAGCLSITAYSVESANTAMVNDLQNSISAVMGYVCILSNQTGVGSIKGFAAGGSPAFPPPPLLDLSPTNGLEIAPASFGAWYPSNYAPTGTSPTGHATGYNVTPTAPVYPPPAPPPSPIPPPTPPAPPPALVESATATFVAVAITGGYQYTLTLNNTGTSTIGTFWFSWVPGQGYLPDLPTVTGSPAGWTASVTDGTPPTNGYSIQWITSSFLPASTAISGFVFTSATTPDVMSGISTIHTGVPVGTSFIYEGAPFSDSGVKIVATGNVVSPPSPPPGPPVYDETLQTAFWTAMTAELSAISSSLMGVSIDAIDPQGLSGQPDVGILDTPSAPVIDAFFSDF